MIDRQTLVLLVFFVSGWMVSASGCGQQAEPGVEADAVSSPDPSVPAPVESQALGDIPNVHRVGSVYLAGQPSERGLSLLRGSGVGVVIDLRKADEDRGFDERAAVEKLGLTYVNPGFRGGGELTDEVFGRVRELLAARDQTPVFLHCGSANRVGGVWLAYRVLDEGVSFDKAIEQARVIGLRTESYVEKARDYIERMRESAGEPSARH